MRGPRTAPCGIPLLTTEKNKNFSSNRQRNNTKTIDRLRKAKY